MRKHNAVAGPVPTPSGAEKKRRGEHRISIKSLDSQLVFYCLTKATVLRNDSAFLVDFEILHFPQIQRVYSKVFEIKEEVSMTSPRAP